MWNLLLGEATSDYSDVIESVLREVALACSTGALVAG